LTYELTSTGIKASFPGSETCENPTVEIPGIEGIYKALQFHIHTSSEHTIDGTSFGAELHTVHKEVDGERYAVVGMMIDPSAMEENLAFGELLEYWMELNNENDSKCIAISGGNRTRTLQTESKRRDLMAEFASPYKLIPADSTFYHYDGGLTTPPWYVCVELLFFLTHG
jgi:carbonic anhydrase